jgi:tetratricopeptide (TPR) repeat protein
MSKKPHRVPPPITSGPATLSGAPLLEEVGGDLGLYLWKTLRSVRLWAEASETERADLFSGAGLAKRREGLLELAANGSLRDLMVQCVEALQAPVQPSTREELARVSREVAAWATDQGRTLTAFEFTQCAAILLPQNAELARSTAVLARQLAQYARSESWYRYAIRVARLSGDWQNHVRSYLGLSTVLQQRGQHPGARKAILRGLRSAKRHGLREATAFAYHDLVVWSMYDEDHAEVMRNANLALRYYPPDHPRRIALGFDVALHWLKLGHFQEALEIIRAIPADYGDGLERVSILVARLRAAAGAGDRTEYETAWGKVLNLLLTESATAQAAASAYVYMARGARMMGEPERARWAATEALTLARRLGELRTEQAAESVLQSLGQPDIDETSPPDVVDPSDSTRQEMSRFTHEFSAAAAPIAASNGE